MTRYQKRALHVPGPRYYSCMASQGVKFFPVPLVVVLFRESHY